MVWICIAHDTVGGGDKDVCDYQKESIFKIKKIKQQYFFSFALVNLYKLPTWPFKIAVLVDSAMEG